MDNYGLIFFASIFIVVILPLIISGFIYNYNFGTKFEKAAVDSKDLSELPNLKMDKRSFKSNKDQAIAGFLYEGEEVTDKGVVILAQGYGTGGHTYYMEIINHFVENGYKVFTYDATGNGESSSLPVAGFPQGIIDLDYAIRYVKGNEDLKNLPIMLWGHSWGGYSVSSVLNEHPDVNAVISVSGVNSSKAVLEDEGSIRYGKLGEIMLPFIVGFERLKFGKYASYNSLKGFIKSNVPVMIIHSMEDERVPRETSYDLYYERFKDEPRFEFVKLHERKHNNPYHTTAAVKYRNEADLSYENYLKENNLKDSFEIKEKYYSENFDREKLMEYDFELMDRMVDFYDRHLVKPVIVTEEEKVVAE